MIGRRLNWSRVALSLAAFTAAGVLVGCGGGDVAPDSDATAAPTTEAPQTSAGGETDDRPVAPDFTLTLQPEGEFVLSDAAKPVYLVFWAEW